MRAVILAGGAGERLATSQPKGLLDLQGKTLLSWALAETAGYSTTVLVRDEDYDDYRRMCELSSVTFEVAREVTPSSSLARAIRVGEQVAVLHVDEVCRGSGGVRAYSAAQRRFRLPIIGMTSATTTRRLKVAVSDSSTTVVSPDGRLDDTIALRIANSDSSQDRLIAENGAEARYIGRFVFDVDRRMIDALDDSQSVLSAVLACHRRSVSLDLPKTYFDCGTDALLASAREASEVE